MVSAETTRRLLRHAGLAGGEGSLVPSIAACTRSGSPDADYLADAVADFLTALTSVNHELSEPEVPRDVAYAVVQVAAMLREHSSDFARRAAWRVDTAWSAVLAGDVDDLHRYLTEEESKR